MVKKGILKAVLFMCHISMKRPIGTILATLLLVIAMVCAASATFESAFIDVFNKSKESLTSIRVVTNEVGEKGQTLSTRGSGFVWTPDGYIATVAHLVTDVKDIEVTIGKHTYKAHVVGMDTPTDIALLKIDNVAGLKPLPLGDSDTIKLGEWVAAIGDPFGLTMTITHGTISGKKRTINDPLDELVQTDAAINPGNSGGPLINLSGEAIGINNLIVSGANNTGFAVPINLVKTVIPILRQKGKVERSTLGCEILDVEDLTERDVRRLNVSATLLDPGARGVIIGAIKPRSPAEKAGLKTGDTVISWNGKRVGSSLEFVRALRILPAGTVVAITVERGSEHLVTTRATLRPLAEFAK